MRPQISLGKPGEIRIYRKLHDDLLDQGADRLEGAVQVVWEASHRAWLPILPRLGIVNLTSKRPFVPESPTSPTSAPRKALPIWLSCWSSLHAAWWVGRCRAARLPKSPYKPCRWRSGAGSTKPARKPAVFDYIEMFSNPVRKHARNGMLPPTNSEQRQILKVEGIYKTGTIQSNKARLPLVCELHFDIVSAASCSSRSRPSLPPRRTARKKCLSSIWISFKPWVKRARTQAWRLLLLLKGRFCIRL
jgi:hypothetical protein